MTTKGHVVHYEAEGQYQEWECDAVAICTGLHGKARVPDIAGLDNVDWIHSKDFKKKAQFGTAKEIMILGSGESGMDIAAMLAEENSVTLCHRDGFHVAPKVRFLARIHIVY